MEEYREIDVFDENGTYFHSRHVMMSSTIYFSHTKHPVGIVTGKIPSRKTRKEK
jgi:hypothetical protein